MATEQLFGECDDDRDDDAITMEGTNTSVYSRVIRKEEVKTLIEGVADRVADNFRDLEPGQYFGVNF